jgi:hypothetical protein
MEFHIDLGTLYDIQGKSHQWEIIKS